MSLRDMCVIVHSYPLTILLIPDILISYEVKSKNKTDMDGCRLDTSLVHNHPYPRQAWGWVAGKRRLTLAFSNNPSSWVRFLGEISPLAFNLHLGNFLKWSFILIAKYFYSLVPTVTLGLLPDTSPVEVFSGEEMIVHTWPGTHG